MTCGNIGVHERIDRSYRLLSDAKRRRVLYALRAEETTTVGELADALVAAGLAEDRDRAVASLVHTHLPKLAEYDAVEYDSEDGVVAASEGMKRLEPQLERTEHREIDTGPWSVAESAPREVS